MKYWSRTPKTNWSESVHLDKREKIVKEITNALHEFGQYYQRDIIGFAIARFVLSVVSCSSDLVLKRWKARFCKENVTCKQCVMCGVQNGIKFQRWCLLIFFPNSVKHSDFSEKDNTEEEFLGFESPSSSEVEGKIKVLEENQDGINLRLTGSCAHGQSLFFCCCLGFTRLKILLHKDTIFLSKELWT